MGRVKRVLLAVAGLLSVLLLVIAVRTVRFDSRQRAFEPAPVPAFPAPGEALERFAAALRIRTVSRAERPRVDAARIRALHDHLHASFPRVHAALSREVVADHSLLYTWPGTQPEAAGVLLLAHQDVVPATEAGWTHPPFSGARADGHVWGRGAIDDKSSLLAQLEAVEWLLADGFQPNRTVVLAFGHDEEVGGADGAGAMASLLASRGQRFEFSLDEGLPIARGIVPGAGVDVAGIAVAERGIVNVELVAEAEGGHGAMPPPQTAAGIVAAAVARLEAHPLPPRLTPAMRAFVGAIGPEMPLPRRAIFANLWLFEPLVVRTLTGRPSTNATVRTTFAVTMLEGSPQANVLPQRARAVVNVRMLPGDTIDGALAAVREIVGDDRVRVIALEDLRKEPSPIARHDTRAFSAIDRAVKEVHPSAITAPGLMVVSTDTFHYLTVAADSYRHLPLLMGPEDTTRPHGVDERLSEASYLDMIRFYRQVIVHGSEGRLGAAGAVGANGAR